MKLYCVHCHPKLVAALYVSSGQSLCGVHMAEYSKTVGDYAKSVSRTTHGLLNKPYK